MKLALAQQSPIALDIGSGGVRAVQLDRRSGRWHTRCWTAARREAVATNVQEATSRPPAQVAAIDLANVHLLDGTFASHDVVVALSPPDVECCPLTVPDNLLNAERGMLVQALRHEAGRHMSMSIDSAEIDFWRLSSASKGGPNVMVVAAQQAVIQRILDWLDGQRLTCRRMDVGPLAAARACAAMMEQPPGEQVWGVLDLGRLADRLYLAVGEVPVYVRCMNKGGDEMTRRIAAELGVDHATAESYKRHYGVHGTDAHYRPALNTDDAIDDRRMSGILQGVLRPVIRGISDEVQRSFRYAMGLYPDHAVGGLWLAGGGANLAGLPELLREALGIPVQRARACRLPVDLGPHASLSDDTVPELVTALGMTLGVTY